MSLTPFERALVAHLVADWLLQNDWMAHHKCKLSHPAAWVHGGIHALALWWALDWRAGLALGLVHTLIDTRIPLAWWIRSFKHSADAPEASSIAMWTDQALHVALLALWISFFACTGSYSEFCRGLAPVAAAIARSRRWKKHRRRSGSFSQPLVMQ